MEEKDIVEVNNVEVNENPQEALEKVKKKWWNKKRTIKVISISLVVAILLSAGIAYFAPKVHWYYLDQKYFDGEKPYITSKFHVIVKSDYNYEVSIGEITLEDFHYENIKKIELNVSLVGYYYDVYLKKYNEKEVKKAIIHCRKLDFVNEAGFGDCWMELLKI